MKKILFMMMLILSHTAHAAKTPIYFWHAMAGKFGETVQTIAQGFNQSQDQYKVIPVYKGNYPETLTSVVAAFRAHQQPHMVQVFDVGTATMLYPSGATIPLYQVLKKANIHLDTKDLYPLIRAYYSDSVDHLMAMPFNISTPVMFYNREALKQTQMPVPSTWPALGKVGKRLRDLGYYCGFTSAWPSWIQLEAFTALHNIPFASAHNGFCSQQAKLLYDVTPVANHLTVLSEWQKQHIFVYGGREDNATALFLSGKCPIMMQSSGSLNYLQNVVNFHVGASLLPYWPSVPGAPKNASIGGAAIWVMSGQKSEDYRGVALFLKYLMRPEIGSYWVAQTGYLPITRGIYQRLKSHGYYQKHPFAKVALDAIRQKPQSPSSRGIRLGFYSRVRDYNEQALEEIFSGTTTAQVALTHAVSRGDILLKRFAENVASIRRPDKTIKSVFFYHSNGRPK